MKDFYIYFFVGIFFLNVLFFIAAFRFKVNKNRFSNLFSKICLVLASIVISIGFLEILVLIFQAQNSSSKRFPPAPQILAKHKANAHIIIEDSILYIAVANQTYRTFGYEFKTNSLGFREREFSLRKPEKVFRILVFGDSLTFGVGVDDDHRYTNLLEEMLNEKIINLKFEVLNFGMGGYSVEQYHDLMKGILKIVECDLVLVGFFRNDLKQVTRSYLSDITLFENGNRIKFEIYNDPIFKNVKRNLSTISDNAPKIFFPKIPAYKKTGIYKLLEKRTNINLNAKIPTPSLWGFVLKEFLGMKALTKKRRLPDPVVVLLHSGQVDPGKNNFKNLKGEMAQTVQLMKFVDRQLSSEGFQVINTLPLFKEHSGMSMAVSEWENHPNYLGHYIYAKSIFDYLLSNIFNTIEPVKRKHQ